jgi:hypothetical protein
MARRDSAEVSRARYTVTGSAPAGTVLTAAAVAPTGWSEASMTLQVASGKDHYYHNRKWAPAMGWRRHQRPCQPHVSRLK